MQRVILTAYPKESVIAEKLGALTSLGLLTSRMKDYFDIWLLSQLYEFDGTVLMEANKATFQHRQTAIALRPAGLSDAFASDPAKEKQWQSFVRRSRFDTAPSICACAAIMPRASGRHSDSGSF